MANFLATLLLSFAFFLHTPDMAQPGFMMEPEPGVRLYMGSTDSMAIMHNGKCADFFVIMNSGGGTFTGSMLALAEAFACEQTVISINGVCASGCTLLLAIAPERVCVTDDANLFFHGPTALTSLEEVLGEIGMEVTEENLAWAQEQREIGYNNIRASMMEVYPEWIQEWLRETGALMLHGQDVAPMTGQYYNTLAPATACDYSEE